MRKIHLLILLLCIFFISCNTHAKYIEVNNTPVGALSETLNDKYLQEQKDTNIRFKEIARFLEDEYIFKVEIQTKNHERMTTLETKINTIFYICGASVILSLINFGVIIYIIKRK